MADEPTTMSTNESIAALVDPIRAAGAVLGFAVGFLATFRMGGDLTGSILHGLLGATILFPLAWFLGLVIVREMIRGNVEEQRGQYDREVAQAKAKLAAQFAAQGLPVPPQLAEHAPRSLEAPSA